MRRSIGTSGRGNMRHGLISLLTVVVVISLATAAVLTISTSHAMKALSEMQASMTSEGYDAERAGQAMLAEVDAFLATARKQGTADAKALAQQLDNKADGMLIDACPEGVTATHSVKDTNFNCVFTTKSGRALDTTISIGADATYDVVSWKLTAAPQEQDTGDMLWTGPTA